MSALNRRIKAILAKGQPRSRMAAELEALVREAERSAAARELETFAQKQDSWCQAVGPSQVISRGAVRDALRARAAALGLTAEQEGENDE